jgi:hypothetical protein
VADGMTVRVEGLEEFNQLVGKLSVELQAVVGAALYEQMLDVMDEAKQICPYLTGALSESGRVNRVRISGGQVSVDLDFGVEPFIPYAVEQHENLSLNHPNGKQAKFLETPVLQWVSNGGPESVIKDVETYLGREIR